MHPPTFLLLLVCLNPSIVLPRAAVCPFASHFTLGVLQRAETKAFLRYQIPPRSDVTIELIEACIRYTLWFNAL
ncbi:hypothetical protein SERLADRAFT_375027 [Serpula lacrymans var. lacrymans S7.9]|uniref:Secreted protein n=1 Tax=Serpula lacrymans var. lacrymans (strain S7.9) TaxID=578457 RepID=F8PE22_SERL9|nr:uncharacterized protein SERLADRAFT_375027 [Serpula lacrymans var. lacrymans S7.9]EGO18619.1 hypothetical protein SERLADRAFT_375027 [Serpula lacrymans var. lacrymans S7.9]